MKPPNRNISTKAKEPTVVAMTIVWKVEAKRRHMAVEARCRANRRKNWQKNLKTIFKIYSVAYGYLSITIISNSYRSISGL